VISAFPASSGCQPGYGLIRCFWQPNVASRFSLDDLVPPRDSGGAAVPHSPLSALRPQPLSIPLVAPE
jgi:hypothetical protein